MGVVAPGNKQLGSWTFNLLSNSNNATIKVSGASGFGLVQTSVVPSPTVPYNVNLGSYALTLLSSSKNQLKIGQVLGLAVVKYTPPSRLYFRSALGLAAVKDPTVNPTINPPRNLEIGLLTFSLLQNVSKPTIYVKSIVGLALVQYSSPRKESTYHSINYGLNNTVKV